MKKKLLFFGYTLDMGGAEKVMTDFFKVLAPHYEIDLALLQAKGELMQELPENVRVIQLRKGLIPYILFRFVPLWRKWKINRLANSKDYFAAIGFIEGRSATWVADIKKDIRKIAWVHNDVAHFHIGIPDREILDSYSKMDTVVLVSREAKDSFVEKYGIDPNRVSVLHNLIDEARILEKAREAVAPNDRFTFVNVGRMRPQKRQDRLVEIAARLKQDGFDFKIQIDGGITLDNVKEVMDAGVDIAVVNRFIKQFEQSQKMMKQMSGMMGKRGRMRFPF